MMNETMKDVQSPKTRHSKWTFLSNAFFQLPDSIIGGVQAGFLIFYYEVVIGLDIWLIFLAVTCFTIYNAISKPILGFLVDQNTRFTRKWGRRFPWIIISIIPWTLSIYLLFSVPDIDVFTNPWPIFGWLILSLLLLNTFSTLVKVNNGALRVDKFRTEEERRTFAKYYTPIDMIANILGLLLPGLFINFIPGDKKTSFGIMGGVVAIISLLFAILYLPGAREDKIMIDRYFSTKTDYKRMNFFKAIKEALKAKSFVVFFIFTTCYTISLSIMVANMLYTTNFVLQPPICIFSFCFTPAEAYLLILGWYLAGTLISIPFWIKYIKKINNNKKAFVVAGLAPCAVLIPLTFFQELFDLLIMAFILGFAYGGLNAFLTAILFPSVVDDFVVRTGKNQKGVLFGISGFLGILVSTIDELIFAVVHDLTGFVAGYDTYDAMAAVVSDMDLVLIGIRLLQGVIPALVLLVGTLVIWKFFPLTQDVVLKNKAELERLGL